jgi:hypothetical protein
MGSHVAALCLCLGLGSLSLAFWPANLDVLKI